MKPVVYVSREIERALGIDPGPDYHIVSNSTPFGQKIKERFPEHVTLLEAPTDKPYGTGELMEQPATAEAVARSGGNVLVFKNTARIEPIVKSRGWNLLNPKASLSEEIENKISQAKWLGALAGLLPPHAIIPASRLRWNGHPYVIQWGHGHTGDGTILIDSEAALRVVEEKFPRRICRRTAYIKGPAFTLNVVAAADRILTSSISYQITGLSPFTDNPFSTVGNDWSAAKTMLSQTDKEDIEKMARDIGIKMNINGWRGLFGIDVIKDEASGRIHLIEINARQPASTAFESFLQEEKMKAGVVGLTTFEAHLRSLLGEKIEDSLIPIENGSQIVKRVGRPGPPGSPALPLAEGTVPALESAGYRTVSYSNTEHNSDLVRIQSSEGIVGPDGHLNARGLEIQRIVSGQTRTA